MSQENQQSKCEGKSVKPQKVLSVIGLILCIVFAVTLICNLTIIIKGTLFPEKPPAVLGISPMVVLSGSMSGDAKDHIEIGDLIFVSKAEPKDLEIGDVISFMEGKIVVTHRIIDIQTGADGELMFITKGDANNAADTNPVTVDQLVGIYRFRLPKVGDFAMFLQKPLGMVLFIGIPVLAYVFYDIVRRQRYANEEKQRREALDAELKRLRELAGEDQ